MLVARRSVTEETVADGDVGFACYEDGGVFGVQVCEEIEREDYAAVGTVFKGDDASVCAIGFHGGEDVFDADLGG